MKKRVCNCNYASQGHQSDCPSGRGAPEGQTVCAVCGAGEPLCRVSGDLRLYCFDHLPQRSADAQCTCSTDAMNVCPACRPRPASASPPRCGHGPACVVCGAPARWSGPSHCDKHRAALVSASATARDAASLNLMRVREILGAKDGETAEAAARRVTEREKALTEEVKALKEQLGQPCACAYCNPNLDGDD